LREGAAATVKVLASRTAEAVSAISTPWRGSLSEFAPGSSISLTSTTPNAASAVQRASLWT